MTVRKLAKHFFLSGIMLVLVSACAAVGGGSGPLTEDERLLRQRSSQFQKNVLQGALAGGVLGGLLGGVIGGDVKSAVIGAGAGAVAGGAGGYYVTKRQQEFASEEARIASMTADVEADNTELKEYLAVAGRSSPPIKQSLRKSSVNTPQTSFRLKKPNNKLKKLKAIVKSLPRRLMGSAKSNRTMSMQWNRQNRKTPRET